MKYYLLDKITAFEKGKSARAIKCITFSDETLHDHFPDFPIMPGALLVESAAQLASFLFEMSINNPGEESPRRSILVQIDKAKFHSFAQPGDRIELTATLTGPTVSSTRARVVLEVEGKKIAAMTLTLASRKIESPHLHEQRRRIYTIWTRDLKPPVEVFY